MTVHLSALVLDEAAAGLPLDEEAKNHLATCSECEHALTTLRASNAAFLARPSAQQALLKVETLARPRFVHRPAVVIALAVAAGLLVWWVAPHAPVDEPRLKGSPEVSLVTEDGHSVTHASPGQVLHLTVGGAGHSRALVLALDQAREVTVLFDGVLQGGASERVARLDVTPGDVLVLGLFTDDPAASAPFLARVKDLAAVAPDPLALDVSPSVRLRLEVP